MTVENKNCIFKWTRKSGLSYILTFTFPFRLITVIIVITFVSREKVLLRLCILGYRYTIDIANFHISQFSFRS